MRSFSIAMFLLILSGLIVAQEVSPGKFSGQFYIDYFYNISRDNSIANLENTVLEGNKDLNGFLIRRAYFTYDYQISEKFSSRFRLEADSRSLTSDNNIGVFVKDAFIKLNNLFDGSDLIVGMQPTPSFEISEKFWSYRSIEKTVQDLRGFNSSRDIGVALRGRLDNDSKINYWLLLGSNSFSGVETDKYKRYYVHLEYKPISGLIITLTGDLMSKPSIADPKDSTSTISNNAIASALFIGYSVDDLFSIGIEGAMLTTRNGLIKLSGSDIEVKDLRAVAFSFFASYKLSQKIGSFFRFDFFDPSVDTDIKGDTRNLFIAGMDFIAEKDISIMPNVLIETLANPDNAISIDPSITGRITLSINF
jgi:hypothetical protein